MKKNRKWLIYYIFIIAIILIVGSITFYSLDKKIKKEEEKKLVLEYAKGYIEKEIDYICNVLIEYRITTLNDEYYVIEVYFITQNYGDYVKKEYIVRYGKYNYIEEMK